MEKLSAILQEHVAQGQDTSDKLVGAAFVVVNKDGVNYSGSAGRTDPDPSAPPLETDSFTWVASMTKLITTTCLMQLVERGDVSLDDDVRGALPELGAFQVLRGFDKDEKPILEDNVKPITLRHLLTHTLGLAYDLADPDIMKWSKSIDRTINCMSWSKAGFSTPLKFAPGDGWYYGPATDWAGLLLEHVTGKTLGEYMQTHIFNPLGMQDTGFWPEKLPQTAERTVSCLYRDSKGLKVGPLPAPSTHEIESGGSGLFTTAKDYGLFLAGFLRGKFLKEETMAQIFSPQLNEAQRDMLEAITYNSGIQDAFGPEFPSGLRLNFGLGGVLNVVGIPGKRAKDSLTWSGMCNSRWWVDRESGVAAVVITNVQPHGDPVVTKLYNQLELAVYEHLTPK